MAGCSRLHREGLPNCLSQPRSFCNRLNVPKQSCGLPALSGRVLNPGRDLEVVARDQGCPDLQVAGCYVAVAKVEQHGLAVGEQMLAALAWRGVLTVGLSIR